MLEKQGDNIIERLRLCEMFTDSEIQQISQLLQTNINQDVQQSGKFNLTVGDGRDFHVGDRYSGATVEQIREIVSGLLQALGSRPPELSQPQLSNDSVDVPKNAEDTDDEPTFRKLTLDLSTVEAVNARLEIILRIANAGHLSPEQRQELKQILKYLQSYNSLNEELQSIVEQGDRLIQQSISAMRLELDALKLSGRELTDNHQAQLSTEDLDCQQEEAQVFQEFIHRLDDSRTGADWIDANTNSLTKYAVRAIRKQFPTLEPSEQTIDDFQFSLKQFLEQVSFSLHWGTYDILDSPEIPLVLDIEYYETAFQAIRGGMSKQLRDEVIREIENCLDYLIERLPFY